MSAKDTARELICEILADSLDGIHGELIRCERCEARIAAAIERAEARGALEDFLSRIEEARDAGLEKAAKAVKSYALEISDRAMTSGRWMIPDRIMAAILSLKRGGRE